MLQFFDFLLWWMKHDSYFDYLCIVCSMIVCIFSFLWLWIHTFAAVHQFAVLDHRRHCILSIWFSPTCFCTWAYISSSYNRVGNEGFWYRSFLLIVFLLLFSFLCHSPYCCYIWSTLVFPIGSIVFYYTILGIVSFLYSSFHQFAFEYLFVFLLHTILCILSI